jgi:hypothetical protein
MHVFHNCLHFESSLCERSGIGLELAKPVGARGFVPCRPKHAVTSGEAMQESRDSVAQAQSSVSRGSSKDPLSCSKSENACPDRGTPIKWLASSAPGNASVQALQVGHPTAARRVAGRLCWLAARWPRQLPATPSIVGPSRSKTKAVDATLHVKKLSSPR